MMKNPFGSGGKLTFVAAATVVCITICWVAYLFSPHKGLEIGVIIRHGVVQDIQREAKLDRLNINPRARFESPDYFPPVSEPKIAEQLMAPTPFAAQEPQNAAPVQKKRVGYYKLTIFYGVDSIAPPRIEYRRCIPYFDFPLVCYLPDAQRLEIPVLRIEEPRGLTAP
jgi:hypothetical protein